MSIEKKVREILLDILDVQENDIVPAARFVDDLEASSIDIVEILTAFENEFDIDVPEDDAANLVTVQDAVDYLKAAVEQKG